jgi:hypothetical protein
MRRCVRIRQTDSSILLENIFMRNTIYFVELEYEGVLAENLVGFYKSSYTDDLGKKHWLSVTHLEPYGARQASQTLNRR